MLASLQRYAAVAPLAAALVCAGALQRFGHPVLALLVGCGLSSAYALVLALEFGMLYVVQSGQSPPRADLRQLLRAWWHEVLAVPPIFMWRQPFRPNTVRDNVGTGSAGQIGVVLVHGFVCNRGLWTPWTRALHSRQVPFVAVDLAPMFGSIDGYADIIEAAVARVESKTRMPVVLVGHSMGGVAIRAWLNRFDADSRVHRVITVGTPHQGTWLARFGHTVNGRQMRLDSPWLKRIAENESTQRRTRFTCFFSDCDNIVFPSSCGALPGALNINVPGAAHVQMLFRKVVFDELLRSLATGRAAATAAAGPIGVAMTPTDDARKVNA